MVTDVKIEYGGLKETRLRIKEYYNVLEEIETSLSGLKRELEKEDSKAVKKLKEKIEDADTSIDGKKETLKELERILEEYIDEMSELVSAVNEGVLTRVDTLDIYKNMNELIRAAGKAEIMGRTSVMAGAGDHSYVDPKDEAAVAQAAANKAKRERNYNKLESYRLNEIVPLGSYLKKRYNKIKDIYKNYLKPFENTDDSYQRRMRGIYNNRTSGKDKWKNFWSDFGKVTLGFLEGIAPFALIAAVILVVPGGGWIVLGVMTAQLVGTAALMAVPEELVPECLKEQKESADAFREQLKDPLSLLGSIGQGLMDDVQTAEGVAVKTGQVAGLLLVIKASKIKKAQGKKSETGKQTKVKGKYKSKKGPKIREGKVNKVKGKTNSKYKVKKGPKIGDAKVNKAKGTSGAKVDPIDSLTPAQRSSINKVDNIIKNNLTEGDFSGTLADLQGKPIPKPGGGYWDHLTEMKQSYKGLSSAKKSIEGSLKNPNLTPQVKTFLKNKLSEINSWMGQIEDLFKSYGGIK